MRILADRSGSFSIGLASLCRFMLIYADQFACSELSPYPSLPVKCSNPFGKYGGSGEYFPLIQFSVTVPFGSCWQGWFPLTGLPWIPPCLGLKCSGILPTFKAPVPKLTYWRWVQISFTTFYCTGRCKLNKLTSLPLYAFTAELVERHTGIMEVTSWNPVKDLLFFSLLPSNCLNWTIYCDDHFSFSSSTVVQNMTFIYISRCNVSTVFAI